jgi:hypothetical protein
MLQLFAITTWGPSGSRMHMMTSSHGSMLSVTQSEARPYAWATTQLEWDDYPMSGVQGTEIFLPYSTCFAPTRPKANVTFIDKGQRAG